MHTNEPNLQDLGLEDHTHSPVPLSERRGPVTMGLLWITMVTGFPAVLAGFDWYRAGLSLWQVLAAQLLSILLLLAYAIPAAYLGSASGLTYGMLSRSIFGKWGSRLVSFNLLWICIGWYGLTAVFLADGLRGLYPIPLPAFWLSVLLALAMALNNFFGFSGVANFARFIAAPVMIAWVGVVFFKAISACPTAVLLEPASTTSSQALMLVSAFTIGYATWGNEADYWRFAKPKLHQSIVPIVVSVLIGMIVFPITGWVMARLTGITDYAAATKLMVDYFLAGWAILAAFVLIVSYVAVNDSGLYGAINAVSNLYKAPRQLVVIILAMSGAATAGFFSGAARAFEWVASLSCIFLPTATVIMLVEWLILGRWLGRPSHFPRVCSWEEVSPVCWPATIALILGCSVGVATAGIIPGSEFLHVGIAPLQAWLTAALVYAALRWLEGPKPPQLPAKESRHAATHERHPATMAPGS